MSVENGSPCEFLNWDTEFWHVPIARARTHTLTDNRVREIDHWCQDSAVECLYFLADDEAPTTALAERNDYHFVDVRMQLSRRISPARLRQTSRHSPRNDIIRPARNDDVESLKRIAGKAHQDSRFYQDPRFPRDLCDRLYETWIQRSCEGMVAIVLVAVMDEKAVGYVSCDLDETRQAGKIGLLGVAPEKRGHGLGRELIYSALDWFAEREIREVSVVTQARNCIAQRSYQRCGFTTDSIGIWFHKWFSRTVSTVAHANIF